MCIFSGRVRHVGATRIFARSSGGEQALVYSMRLGTDEEVAMVLPVPTAQRAAEEAIRFVNLEDLSGFFEEMDLGFPQSLSLGMTRGAVTGGAPKLAVHEVGAFEASFVPTRTDFDRLDARFRLSDAVWASLPQYRDWGFVVFKLKPGEHRVHPMAFWFPSRDPDTLYFPTVHVHDGRVKSWAEFDHTLYAQGTLQLATPDWQRSHGQAASFMDVDQTRGLVRGDAPCHRRRLVGAADNRDVFVPCGAEPAVAAPPDAEVPKTPLPEPTTGLFARLAGWLSGKS